MSKLLNPRGLHIVCNDKIILVKWGKSRVMQVDNDEATTTASREVAARQEVEVVRRDTMQQSASANEGGGGQGWMHEAVAQ